MVVFEDNSGSRSSANLKTENAEPYWYTGQGCYWEERKYKKAKMMEGHLWINYFYT
jgi:hypothetical protein